MKITADWVREKLEETGRSRTELADALGIDYNKVTKIVTGYRRVQPHEVLPLLAFFGIAADDEIAREQNDVVSWQPARGSRTEGAVALLTQGARRAEIYRLTTDCPAWSLLAGDVLVVDIGDLGATGDLVLAGIAYPDGEVATRVMRRVGSWLVPPQPLDPPVEIADATGQTAVRGRIIGSFRRHETSA